MSGTEISGQASRPKSRPICCTTEVLPVPVSPRSFTKQKPNSYGSNTADLPRSTKNPTNQQGGLVIPYSRCQPLQGVLTNAVTFGAISTTVCSAPAILARVQRCRQRAHNEKPGRFKDLNRVQSSKKCKV